MRLRDRLDALEQALQPADAYRLLVLPDGSDESAERAAAKERQLAGKRDLPAHGPEGSTTRGEALDHVAAETGVPVRTLRRAAFVNKHAVEEVRRSGVWPRNCPLAAPEILPGGQGCRSIASKPL